MTSSFAGLGAGVLVAIALVYFLIVVNFQSWLDPFIIITALPGALAGIVWTLLLTHTTLNVPSLTGTIMCMGVATANSILLVSFARERMNHGLGATRDAALDAGFVRIRPVIMTAFAMIIGMVPMSLGLGEGGEQNAPLGRAVIGGLIVATFATLFFVPCVFSLVHGRKRENRRSSRPRHQAERVSETPFPVRRTWPDCVRMSKMNQTSIEPPVVEAGDHSIVKIKPAREARASRRGQETHEMVPRAFPGFSGPGWQSTATKKARSQQVLAKQTDRMGVSSALPWFTPLRSAVNLSSFCRETSSPTWNRRSTPAPTAI